MVKENKASKKKEWVQKGDHRTIIQNGDDELFPYWKGHQSLNDLKKVASELLEWSLNTKAINITDFPIEKGMTPSRFYEWMSRSPELKEAWDIARYRIGRIREEKGLKGEYNSSIVLAKMPMFDPEYRAWKEQLAQKATEGAAIKVEIQTISSDVPKRVEEES
jgi:hypothetical protein